MFPDRYFSTATTFYWPIDYLPETSDVVAKIDVTVSDFAPYTVTLSDVSRA